MSQVLYGIEDVSVNMLAKEGDGLLNVSLLPILRDLIFSRDAHGIYRAELRLQVRESHALHFVSKAITQKQIMILKVQTSAGEEIRGALVIGTAERSYSNGEAIEMLTMVRA